MRTIFILTFCLTLSRIIYSQSGPIVDINSSSGNSGSNPANFIKNAGQIYFSAYTPDLGYALYKTNGTDAGTLLIEDLDNEHEYDVSTFSNFTKCGSFVFFLAEGYFTGKELWRSDGTDNGTFMLKDIRSGSTSSNIQNIIVWGSTLYFTAESYSNGRELWKSDGTTAGTVLVKDINPGSANGPDGIMMQLIGSKIYLSANDGVNGTELWSSDGTAAGTVLVKDINPAGSSSPSNIFKLGSKTVFYASDGTTGNELWTTNGTAAGTVIIKDINASGDGVFNYTPLVIGSIAYFPGSNGVKGTELWRTNGSAGGTAMVKDIYPGSSSSIINYSFHELGGKLVFAASNNTYGEEIWISDGTNAGTILLNDINPGIANSYVPNSPINFVVGSNYYFTANTASIGNELWKSDGTVAGTVLVKDINSGTASSFVDGFDYVNAISGTSIIFNATDENGNELWITDGTEAGTMLIKDILPGTGFDIDNNSFPKSSDPDNLVNIDGIIYFAASSEFGTELWRSDGTNAGTYLIKDINCCNSESSFPANFYIHDDKTFFSASNGINGTEAFVTDGTTTGTVMLQDANPSDYDYDFENVEMEFAEFGGYIYYTNNRGQLCKTDGSAAGSSVVFNTGEDKSYSIRSNGSIIYFLTAMHGPVGDTVKLWKSDGTALGTIKLKTLTLNPSAEYATEFLGFTGGYLLFAAQKTATSNYELFKSDGTPEGTILLKEIQNAAAGSYPSHGFEYDGDVFFSAASSTYGNELWRSNGTGGGTQMVKDMRVGIQSSYPRNIIEMGGLLYFTAEQDGTYDRGLWVSDGTTAGTYRIKDLDIPEPDPDDDHSPVLIAMDGKIYFRILDKLWQSDGTELGTYQVYDVPLGIPENKVVFNHVIYFTADEALYRFDGNCGNKELLDLNDLDYNFSEYTLFATNEHLYIILSTPTYGYELWQFTDDQLMPVKCIPDNDEYCQGELFDVDYEFICTSSPNTFNVEISNSTGSFDSPTIIGTSGSYSYSGTIPYCEIPTDVPSGTGYRMRITSTNTAQISPDNGFDITVLESPVANINTPNGHDLCGFDSLLLKTSGAPGYSYNWIKSGYFIAGAISKLYYAKEPGNYSVRITDPAGCYTISEDKHIIETCRKPNDDFANADILIAPNPNSGAFTITIDQINENSKIEIYNSVGQVIYSEQINSSNNNYSQTISLENISSGIYFVRVGDGNNYDEQKLIIENK